MLSQLPDPIALERLATWRDALRSGKYDQAQGYLRTASDEYCCLGVACDLSPGAPLHWHLETSTAREDLKVYNFDTAQGFPTASVSEWMLPGMENRYGEQIHLNFLYRALFPEHALFSDFNDGHHYTFNQIADIIDRCIERLQQLYADQVIPVYKATP